MSAQVPVSDLKYSMMYGDRISSARQGVYLGVKIVLLSSWAGWHPASWRHICSECLDVCNTHINTQLVKHPEAGWLDMFYLLPCGCFLLHSHFYNHLSTPHLCCLPFPPSLASSFSCLISVSMYLSFHLSSLIPPLGPSKTASPPQNTAWSSPLLSSPPPLIFHPSPPPSMSTLCACITSSPKMICVVYIHPSPPRLYTLLQLGDVKSS